MSEQSGIFVRCQICGETIAEIKNFLHYPLKGGMFESPDQAHGFPPPFDPSEEWESFRCPYGRIHRPFLRDDEIMTDQGMFRVHPGGYVQTGFPPAEIDRNSITDRTMTMSDDAANEYVRSQMEINNGKTEEGQGQAADVEPVKETEESEAPGPDGPSVEPMRTDGEHEGLHGCDKCGRVFKRRAGLTSHMRFAHQETDNA